MVDREALRACTTSDLTDTAVRLVSLMSATHAALLEVLAELNDRQVHRADACVSMVDWSSFRLGITRKTAHEWMEAAVRLEGLPKIAETFASGRFSWDKTKTVSTLAEALRHAEGSLDESNLIDEAINTDADRVEVAARRAKRVSTREAQRRERQRFLALRRSRDRGGLSISGFLPDADAEIVARAIEALAERAEKNPDTDLYPPYDHRCADALVEMASNALAQAQSERGDRAMVVTHVDLGTLVDGDGPAEFECALPISAETARRLACDSSIAFSYEVKWPTPLCER